MDGDGLAGIIDEEFFPGPVFLAETDIEFLDPLAIAFTELAVLVSVGVGLFIFVPEELQGDAFLFASPGEDTPWGASGVFLGDQGHGEERADSPKRHHPSPGEGARSARLVSARWRYS